MTAAQHELVLYSRDEHVVTITLNRPEKRNAFNAELVKELRAALLRFEADDDAFVAVMTGSGPCFSSGADVGERQIRSVAEFDRLGGPQEPDAHTADLLARLPKSKPIVAAVHGVVMGLGIGVAFECDLVVGFFSAAEAAAVGIVGSIAPPGSVVETATALARQIAANPPLSVQATVRARRWFMDQAERAAMAITDPMKLYLTEDFREALAAHLDKRKPRPFRGR
jgi:enoyl-CoA hydratase/carnithine racemase